MQYNALERIDSCALINDIKVILVATPFRTSFLDEELIRSLGNWNLYLDSVVSTYRNIKVLHFQEALWHDSLYVDRNHMNEIGARQLTNKILLEYDFASFK